MKPIILYYSRSGNTEKLAKRASFELKCDMLKIEPEVKYGNYVSSIIRVMKETSNSVSPKFITPIPDLSPYDVILLGFPTWSQDMPAFVAEFANRCDLRGKTVIPFTTFGMNGADWGKRTLEKVCAGAEVKLPFSQGLMKKDAYGRWINGIREII